MRDKESGFGRNPLQTVSMSELYENVYPGKMPVIDGLLYGGTYLFVGAPKIGKSFLMAQNAYHVSTGMPLWDFPVHKGTVLYLAMEDDFSRLQERMYRMFGTESAENLHFSIASVRLNEGLDEQLADFIEQYPDTKLIIIDTLQRVRNLSREQYSYSSDYDAITGLKRFTDRTGICLLLVHHTRKQSADDCFDMISGTNGLLGAADGAFLLQKVKRTGNAAILEVSGRDQQDQKLYLARDPEKLVWTLDHAETELWREKPDPILGAVVKMLSTDNPEWTGSPTELANRLGMELKANALTTKLNIHAGKLLNEYGIRYENRRTHSGRWVIVDDSVFICNQVANRIRGNVVQFIQ